MSLLEFVTMMVVCSMFVIMTFSMLYTIDQRHKKEMEEKRKKAS